MSAAWSVEFYEDHRGHKPALEFIEGLPPKEAAAVLRAVDLLEEHGTALREPYAKHMRGAIWELRAGAGRVFYFYLVEHRFVLLHGYRKTSPKAPDREIARAERYMQDYVRSR